MVRQHVKITQESVRCSAMAVRFDHALVTGGSSGIGRAVAELLVARGGAVSLIARDAARLHAAQRELRAAHPGARIEVFAADVSSAAALEAAIGAAVRASGPVDLLVNCAGIAEPGYFGRQPHDVHERTMAINYFGTLYATRAVVPAMVERQRGHLVFVASAVALLGMFGYTSYAPSKFAVRGLAESLRAELEPCGVGVTIVYPPDTDTPQLAAEQHTRPVEPRRIAATAGVWSAGAVAREVVRGVERRRLVVAPGAPLWLLARLHSLIAPLLNRHFDRLARRAARRP
jgi:3-dehydrosphinganine reductase